MKTTNQLKPKRSANARLIIVGCVVVVIAAILIALWLTSEERPKEFLKAWDSPVDQLTILKVSPDGEQMVTVAATGDVVVWESYSGKPKLLEKFTLLPISAVGISPDGFVAATDIQDNMAGWQIDEMKPTILPKLPAHAADIGFGRTRSGSLIVAVALTNGQLAFVDPDGVKTVETPHQGGIRRLRFAAKGRVLVTAGVDGKLVWWDARERKSQDIIDAHSNEIGAIEFSDDESSLVSGDWNGELKIWDVKKRKISKVLHQAGSVSSIAWSDKKFATGSWDGVLRFWDLDQDQPESEIKIGRAIHDLAFTTDHSQVATVSGRDEIEWWRVNPN